MNKRKILGYAMIAVPVLVFLVGVALFVCWWYPFVCIGAGYFGWKYCDKALNLIVGGKQ